MKAKSIKELGPREQRRYLATLMKRWGRTELNQKPSGRIGRTRRGRLKGDIGKGRNERLQRTFPYPKRGAHQVVDGKTVAV